MSRKAIYGGFLSMWRGLGRGRGSGTLVPATSQQEMTARRVMPHHHGHSLQVTPQDHPKTQMCCPRRGTSSHTLSHKTWKQDQKEKSKARSQIKTRTSPHPKQPPSTNSKKYGADSSVAPPPSPQLDTGRLYPDTFRPPCSGRGWAGLCQGAVKLGPQPTVHPWGAEGSGVLRSNQTHQRVLLVREDWGVWF